jgi:FkbM family methyltransferase
MADKLSRRILLIGKILRFLERHFFDPKLKQSLVLALEESKAIRNYSAGDEVICFDIGANRGQTIRLFKEIFPNCKIYAFEPHPNIFKTLMSSYKLVKGVKCFNLAVGELSGKFPFWVSPLDEASSMNLPDLDSTWNRKKALILGINPKKMYKKIDVDVVTLDEFTSLHEIQAIDILKIDVEGGELQVLLGSRSIFQEGRVSIVQYESHDDDLRPSQQIQIETLLAGYGFVEYSNIKHSFGDFSDKIYIKRG